MQRLVSSVLLLGLVSLGACKTDQHVPIGYANSGISFGNSERWNGLRFNFRDNGIDRINGVNVTLWKAGPEPNGDVNGVGLGLYGNDGAELTGVFAGLLENTASEEIEGIYLAGIANRSRGDLSCLGAAIGFNSAVEDIHWVNLAGGVNKAGGDLCGVQAALLAQLAGEDQNGLHLTGIYAEADGSQNGVQLAGLWTRAGDCLKGVSAALGMVHADRNAVGVNVGGLTASAGEGINGLNAALLGVLGKQAVRGISLGGLAVIADDQSRFQSLWHHGTHPFGAPLAEDDTHLCGLALAGLMTKANDAYGMVGSLLHNRARDFEGLAIGGSNWVADEQTGVSIGLFNHAHEFEGFGFQLGLLNHVPSNPEWARWLPLFNMGF